MNHTILLSFLRATLAACEPLDRLNGSFQDYLAATRTSSFRYDKALNAQIGDFETLPRLVDQLQGKGFDVALTPELRDALAAYDAQQAPAAGDLDGLLADLAKLGRAPLDYQGEGISLLRDRRSGYLGWDMGLGKTMASLLSAPRGAAVVVVCPKSVQGSWAREVATWRPDLVPVILRGRGSFRWPVAGEVVITNWNILAKGDELAKLDAPRGVVVLMDEVHYAKSFASQRTKSVRALCRAAAKAGGAAYGLTGTPILNDPGELWTILQTTNSGTEAFGDFETFMRLFGGRRGAFGIEWPKRKDVIADDGELSWEFEDENGGTWYPQPDYATAIEMLSKVMLVRRKDDVLKSLPAKRREYVPVEVSTAALREMDGVVRTLEAQGFSIVDGRILTKLGHEATLADITGNQIAFEKISRMRAIVAAAKVEAAVELVTQYEEAGEPVVVFTAHVEPAKVLAARPGWALIDGSVSTDARTQAIADFQSGKLKGIVGTRAMAEGVTLTRASHMVFIDLFWSPAINAQAEDRIHRIGQKNACLYRILETSHAIDALVRNLIADKAALIDNTIGQLAKREAAAAPTSKFAKVLALPTRVKAAAAKPAAAPTATAPVAQQPAVGPFKALIEMLEKSGNKYPQVSMMTKGGKPVTVSACGENSRYVGSYNVTDGGPFGSSTFYGRLNANGTTGPGRGEVTNVEVLEAMHDFVKDPAAAAKVYALATSCCCFCRRDLEQPESVERGYGPDCADKWGLPFDGARYTRDLAAARSIAKLAKG